MDLMEWLSSNADAVIYAGVVIAFVSGFVAGKLDGNSKREARAYDEGLRRGWENG